MKQKHIYHRKDGRWEYTLVKEGQKVYLIASTREKLLEKIKNFKQESTQVVFKPVHETLFEWAQKWLELYKKPNLVTSTYKQYFYFVNNHLKKFFKNTTLKDLSQEKVQRFINHFPDGKIKDFGYLTIRQILKQAFINKKISENIAETVVKPRRRAKPHKTALSYAEQEKFLEVLKTHEVDVQMFMLFSLVLGSRRAETLAFKFEDINKERNTIHIKGTKTYGADRKIKISNAMIALLEENLQVRKNQYYFKYVKDNYSKKARDIFAAAGIKGKTLHDLRHTCSTNLYYLGVTDKQRQQVLGHASILMTNDVYTNLQDDLDKESILKLYNNLYYEF